jgi:excisionase family DNA binding protein
MSDYLSAGEVAALLGFSLSFIYRELESGRMRGSKPGGRWRVLRADVEAYMRRYHHDAQAEA